VTIIESFYKNEMKPILNKKNENFESEKMLVHFFLTSKGDAA